MPPDPKVGIRGTRAISVQLASATGGLSRSLADTPTRRSGLWKAGAEQIPKLTVQVRFPLHAKTQVGTDFRT
jgi:hypothetical protein